MQLNIKEYPHAKGNPCVFVIEAKCVWKGDTKNDVVTSDSGRMWCHKPDDVINGPKFFGCF